MIDIHTKYEEQQLLIASGAWTTSSSSSVPDGQGTDGRATTTLAPQNQLLAGGSVGGGGGGGGGYQNPVFNLESGGEGVQHEGFWQGGDDVAGQRYEYLQIQQSQYWRRLTVEQQQRWGNNFNQLVEKKFKIISINYEKYNYRRFEIFLSDTGFTLLLVWRMQPTCIQASPLSILLNKQCSYDSCNNSLTTEY